MLQAWCLAGRQRWGCRGGGLSVQAAWYSQQFVVQVCSILFSSLSGWHEVTGGRWVQKKATMSLQCSGGGRRVLLCAMWPCRKWR